jgi:hypothetical protein
MKTNTRIALLGSLSLLVSCNLLHNAKVVKGAGSSIIAAPSKSKAVINMDDAQRISTDAAWRSAGNITLEMPTGSLLPGRPPSQIPLNYRPIAYQLWKLPSSIDAADSILPIPPPKHITIYELTLSKDGNKFSGRAVCVPGNYVGLQKSLASERFHIGMLEEIISLATGEQKQEIIDTINTSDAAIGPFPLYQLKFSGDFVLGFTDKIELSRLP